ncbi:hypothetical protein NUM_47190 [Actinocatenispora comari]|uniref:Uncharacterized protein n=1 Tax=Actinocatenispora comari TaxID=2807577 RepID=A0A8J4AH66_9ACTN|nr:hypothetical protein NUM_47190 [Actinocatenispora comari]
MGMPDRAPPILDTHSASMGILTGGWAGMAKGAAPLAGKEREEGAKPSPRIPPRGVKATSRGGLPPAPEANGSGPHTSTPGAQRRSSDPAGNQRTQ